MHQYQAKSSASLLFRQWSSQALLSVRASSLELSARGYVALVEFLRIGSEPALGMALVLAQATALATARALATAMSYVL